MTTEAKEKHVIREAVFSRVMLDARRSRGMSQEAVGAACVPPVDQSQIARREAGVRQVLESALESTASAFGKSARQLLLEALAPRKAKAMTFDPSEQRALSRCIRAVRLSKKLDRAGMAAAVGVDPTRISRWEAGGRDIGEAVIDRCAAALGMTEVEFLVLGLTTEVRDNSADQAEQDAEVRARLATAIGAGKTNGSEIANVMGVNRSTISRFLGGRSAPDGVRARLMKALDKIDRDDPAWRAV